MSKNPVEGYDDDKYFDADMLRTSLENNKAYIRLLGKKFHRFMVVEIMNEYEVKEHFTFIHPFYGKGTYQRLYLANNIEFMLERLIN